MKEAVAATDTPFPAVAVELMVTDPVPSGGLIVMLVPAIILVTSPPCQAYEALNTLLEPNGPNTPAPVINEAV